MTTQQHSSNTVATLNEHVGRHRPTVPTWQPTPDYGPAPDVAAGVGVTLGVDPHLTLVDLTGGMVRIPLNPETVEHIVLEAKAFTSAREARYAEQAREIEASNARQDRFFRDNERIEATA
ncbi:hypothetical protein GCM10009740_31690 [Terrabacter terrae]|uniref:Uncharacterized protein n=1 Tax=Terrabacter terrae TaxID=318434 RepID=A0ABP5FZT0_9MICO